MTQINVANERFNIQLENKLTWNVKPLLHQVRHALEELLSSGKTTVIDLRSIPLAPGEEETILTSLGVGEVQVRMDALGLSEIIETGYSGVWLVTHYNDDEDIIGRFIEVTHIPAILLSQKEDMQAACEALAETLEES